MSFVCPLCKGKLIRGADDYRCPACKRAYPVICGIPDFRILPDPYIELAKDRVKGALLAAAGRTRGFEELVRYYYDITPEDPPDLAKHWIARALAEVEIARFAVAQYGLTGRTFLDVGCSTGAMLAAASEHCESVTGVDVAFRWLIVGQVRLRELGIHANLVCANAEHLPFASETFDRVSALDLLEHVPQPRLAVREAFRVSQQDARTVFRTNNRFAPLPEPHVRLWGVGWLPRRWQAAYVAMRRKDLHRYRIALLSSGELARLCRDAGYRFVHVASAPLYAPQFSKPAQRAFASYNAVRKWPFIAGLLRRVGPLLVAIAER